MLSRFSSNVILSKVRAMYSRRMTTKDYSSLLNCKNVGEIAAFLKQQSSEYSQILTPINENDVHRGQLENLIRKKIFRDSLSICRYELSVGEHFSEYIIKSTEIEQILHTIRLILAGKSPDLIYTMPIFFTKHTSIDFPLLTKVKNQEEFLDTIKGSDYGRILHKFKSQLCNKESVLTEIEVELYGYLYGNIYRVIGRYIHGNTKKELCKIFDSYIDLFNFVTIVRMKRYYNMSFNCMKLVLLPFGTLKQKYLHAMIEASDYKEVVEIMKNTTAGKKLDSIEYGSIDELPLKLSNKICSHYIRFSSNPSVVMFSYINLTKVELSNIINIIEGVRYRVSSEEIVKILTLN
ncbi:MAG: V-type ATPase subunit [Oscillospiraceae bacterium]|nr:V-type ATPase subunit [Oscillospiraceae bacterium]